MRNVLYFALCITLCAAIGCDEPEQPTAPDTPTVPTDPTTPMDPSTPTDPTTPTDPSTPTDPTTPTDPNPTTPTDPATPPSVITADETQGGAVTLKSVNVNANEKIILDWERYGGPGYQNDTGKTTLLGIKAKSGSVSDAIFEEVGIEGNNLIILFGEKDYASSGFAKSVNNVVLQELLLYEGLAEVDVATSNAVEGQADKNKISYPTYTAWKALEVHTPPAGNGNSTLNN